MAFLVTALYGPAAPCKTTNYSFVCAKALYTKKEGSMDKGISSVKDTDQHCIFKISHWVIPEDT